MRIIYFVKDKRGFDFIARNFQAINSIPVEFGKRVSSIKYDVTGDYPVLVTANHTNTGGGCIQYMAKCVLSTVSIGVYERGVIAFDPLLRYGSEPPWVHI
jgi:hypothetical protein